MRVLVISNLYPPHYIGGYELGCKDIVDRLGERGHEVRVLTSTYGVESARVEGNVYRWLDARFERDPRPFPRGVPALVRSERRNQRAARRVLASFEPDLVYVWNLRGVSVSVAQLAEASGAPVCYFVSDKWWSRREAEDPDPWCELWQQFPAPRPHVRAALGASALALSACGVSRPAPLALRHVHFVSDFLRRDALAAGKRIERAEVIQWGVNAEQFGYRRGARRPQRLLYIGQITPYKGFHTVVEAMRLVAEARGRETPKLTVVGGSVVPNYIEEVRALAHSYGLDDYIEFAGFAARESLPRVYHEHDVLLFTSLLDEALTITTLEAMACGVAVVTTSTGGNPEVFRHEQNALTFEKGDAATAAAHVLRLLEDEELFERLRQNARRDVEEQFNLERMADEIDRSLRAAVAARAGFGGAGLPAITKRV